MQQNRGGLNEVLLLTGIQQEVAGQRSNMLRLPREPQLRREVEIKDLSTLLLRTFYSVKLGFQHQKTL